MYSAIFILLNYYMCIEHPSSRHACNSHISHNTHTPHGEDSALARVHTPLKLLYYRSRFCERLFIFRYKLMHFF